MVRKLWLMGLLVGLFLSLGAGQNDKSYSANSFDVAVTVEEGGSLLVQETVIFHFVGGPFTFVFRELPADHTDGITDIMAALNGRSLPAGTNPGQVEITGRNPIRITWHFEPTLDSAHTFTLSYRVLGVVQQSQGGDLLKWQALPDDYEYTIGRSQVTFSWPSAAELSAAPAILAGNGSLTNGPGRLLWTGENLQPGDPLVIQVPFTAGSLITAPPEWQARQQQRDRYAWVWAVAAGGLLLAGAITLAISLWSPQRHPPTLAAGTTYQPPTDLPPALAGILRDGGANPSWQHALGSLFSLADRGILTIEEKAKTKWYESRDFVIRQTAYPTNLPAHEESLLNLLFVSKSGRSEEIKLSKLSGLLTSSRWKQHTESVKAELKAAGFLSAAQLQLRRRLQIAATLWLFLALVMFLLTMGLLPTFGGWPLLAVGSLLLVSIIWYAAAGSLSILSEAGQQAAAEWKAFYHHLRDVSRGKAAVSRPDMFEQYLPYAAAFGLLTNWTKQFKKTGWTRVPAYFHALSTAGDDGMAAFVAMSHASASSAANSGAAGAAGAGGWWRGQRGRLDGEEVGSEQ